MDKEFFKNFPNQMFNCDILNCFQKEYFKIAIKKKIKNVYFQIAGRLVLALIFS